MMDIPTSHKHNINDIRRAQERIKDRCWKNETLIGLIISISQKRLETYCIMMTKEILTIIRACISPYNNMVTTTISIALFTISFITILEPLTLLNLNPPCALNVWNDFISSCCFDFVFSRNVGCRYLLIKAGPSGYTSLNTSRYSGLGGKVGVFHKRVV